MIDEGPLEALAAWGASQQVIDEWRSNLLKQAREQGVDVWPEHWYATQVFLSMETQWRVVAGFGGLIYQGLDYSALPIALAERRASPFRKPVSELMPQLRTLELAARDELNRE